ncbi:hypothetical protein BGZ96_012045, partial [Linnemannia gamsii]
TPIGKVKAHQPILKAPQDASADDPGTFGKLPDTDQFGRNKNTGGLFAQLQQTERTRGNRAHGKPA